MIEVLFVLLEERLEVGLVNPGGTLSEQVLVSDGIHREGEFAHLSLREGEEEQEKSLDFPVEGKPAGFHCMSTEGIQNGFSEWKMDTYASGTDQLTNHSQTYSMAMRTPMVHQYMERFWRASRSFRASALYVAKEGRRNANQALRKG